MKAIPYVLLLPLALIVLFTQCEKEEPLVLINDNNFLNALIEIGIDNDGDGQISHAEAEMVKYLDVDGNSISDMTGIEKFVNLEILDCSSNQLTSLDVSNNTELVVLLCHNNQLTSLDVSNNTALKDLICDWNQLTSLDVSKNPALISLSCSGNDFTSLDVSNNTVLKSLICDWNQLTSLDVSNNTALLYLWCDNNQLTTLDLSNNMQIWFLSLREMPSLQEVCVWTMPFPPESVDLNTEGSPNVNFTTECSK